MGYLNPVRLPLDATPNCQDGSSLYPRHKIWLLMQMKHRGRCLSHSSLDSAQLWRGDLALPGPFVDAGALPNMLLILISEDV
jgi:hypothetical protein